MALPFRGSGVSLRFASGRAFALRVEPRCASLAPDGLQSLTSSRRPGAARFACSRDTRPLLAGELPVQRPAMPAERARGRTAPRRVGGSAGETVWLRSILLRRVKRVDLPLGAAPFRRIARARTGARVKAALRFAHVLARSVLGYACAPHAASGRALAPVRARAKPASRRLPMADPQPDTKGRNRERNHPRPNHPHTRGRSPRTPRGSPPGRHPAIEKPLACDGRALVWLPHRRLDSCPASLDSP
ncbi:hypothetical protein BSE24067_03663 [Burkholderia seminalis]|nr:hypothetical protein BSE24067_03663 [Burkholderia seminalis]